MSNNSKIIKEFEKLADQIAFEMDSTPKTDKKEQIKHSFRLKQIKNVIKILKAYPDEIVSGEQLKDIKGVGAHSVERINEILKTGKLKEIKMSKVSKKDLEYIEELEKVINIGRKKAVELVKDKNIRSVQQLKDAYNRGEIALNDKVLLGLKYFDIYKQNIPRAEVTKIEMYLKDQIMKVDNELFLIICGSYRRLKPTSNDIDVLITHPHIKTVKQFADAKRNYLKDFVIELKKNGFLLDDLTDKNFNNKYMGFCRFKKNPIRRIDIRYVPYESYYPALLYFTGSGNFNRKMREVAISLGYKLNEYGLYKIVDDRFKKIKVSSEKDIFDKLGMEYVDPVDRI